MRKIRACAWCDKGFTRVGHAQPKYCSPECFARGRRKGRTLASYTCLRCGKEFERYESQVRNPNRTYCSGECRSANRVYVKGSDNPLWKGGTHINNGYRMEVDRSKRKINGEYGYRAAHMRIAEEKLGRSLAKGEHVHHLNGIKLDNRPENLLVLSASQHRALHHFYSQLFQQEHAAAGDLEALTLNFLASQ